MDFEELLKFIKKESTGSMQNCKLDATSLERILSCVVKMNEEVGELCGEVLCSQGGQRQEKLDNYKKENLEGEFADVMITVLMLAEVMGVDIKKALKNKIKKIEERRKK